ncbi:MAG TPA: hypothetical protein VMT28_13855 [Terriglobales bacterium]|jgi:hypothetical protein|nr:hypothetical protein [Terriglobales bacterium]
MAAAKRQARRQASLDDFFPRLHESREVCVYEAIERLVQAGEEVGLSVETLIQMLDAGVTLESLLDVIESRMAAKGEAA